MTVQARIFSAIALAAFVAVPTTLPSAITRHAQPQVATREAPLPEPVDINTASLQQLLKIPGLTRTWAARIIRYRPYRGKNELLDRGVIPAGVYARIKDSVIAHRQGR